MKKIIAMLAVVAMLLPSCGSVPITGRKQLNLVSDAEVLQASLQQYASFMQTATLSTQKAKSAQVTRVGQRIAAATEAYLKYAGLESELQNFAWEFNLVKSDDVNAWCMPGGKIVVYEGILPVTQDEASLAIVLGHEIAHAVAKHSAERISNEYKQQAAVSVLGGVASAAGMGPNTASIASSVIGIGTKAWTSGFSRSQESEADHIGLIFAAMAGYDPQGALAFWQRMAAAGNSSNSIFSDHPSDEKRIKQIQGWIPEAMKYYKPTSTNSTSTSSKAVTSTKTLKYSTKK